MAFGVIDTSILTAIANAIRTKLGVQTTYKPSEMATAIGQISGGITPTGTKEITENGTYDVTSYASAEVSVSGGGQSLPFFVSQEDITITEDHTSSADTVSAFQSTYLPALGSEDMPFPTVIYLIENTNTDATYAAQAAARVSSLASLGYATSRVFIRTSGAVTQSNYSFFLGAGSVMHKYVFRGSTS